MNDTALTCVTQVITTILTIGASVLIAFFTYKSQVAKAGNETKRLQKINRDAALELFYAYVASLTYFISIKPTDLNKKEALLHCKKMKIVEIHLTELTDSDLPDSFIKDFQIIRLKTALFRVSLEEKLEEIDSAVFSYDLLAGLQPKEHLESIMHFINEYKKSSKP